MHGCALYAGLQLAEISSIPRSVVEDAKTISAQIHLQKKVSGLCDMLILHPSMSRQIWQRTNKYRNKIQLHISLATQPSKEILLTLNKIVAQVYKVVAMMELHFFFLTSIVTEIYHASNHLSLPAESRPVSWVSPPEGCVQAGHTSGAGCKKFPAGQWHTADLPAKLESNVLERTGRRKKRRRGRPRGSRRGTGRVTVATGTWLAIQHQRKCTKQSSKVHFVLILVLMLTL